MARTSFGPGNVAIISETHCYIRYNDGSEELYDRKADPHKWNNVAENLEKKTVLEKHRARLPKTFHPILGEILQATRPSRRPRSNVKGPGVRSAMPMISWHGSDIHWRDYAIGRFDQGVYSTL